LVLPRGIGVLRRRLPELLEDAENGLSDLMRRLLAQSQHQLEELDAHIREYAQELETQSRHSDACRRLQSIPGYGPIVASVFYNAVGDGSGLRRGRDVSASLGLVPRQHSSSGKELLPGISKVRAERDFNKAVVALANKLARIGWAVLSRNTVYRAAPATP
jgi:transposase